MTINRRTLFSFASGLLLGGSITRAEAQSSQAPQNPGRVGGQGMTEQERNKQVVRDYFDRCFNKGDLDFGRTIMIPDYDYHLLTTPPLAQRGYEGWRRGVAGFRVVFPDCHWEIHQMAAEGDLVSVRTVWSGTHSAEFMGIPASGRRVVAANSDYYRMRDGKFVEHWDVPDWLAIVRQIGGSLESAARFGASIDP